MKIYKHDAGHLTKMASMSIYGKAQITKFDLAVKLVKVTPGSSFEQTCDGQESPILHTKFRGNRPAGSGEEGFLPYIWAWRPSWSCDQHHVKIFSYPCT